METHISLHIFENLFQMYENGYMNLKADKITKIQEQMKTRAGIL